VQRRRPYVLGVQMWSMKSRIDSKLIALRPVVVHAGGYLARVSSHLGAPKYRSDDVPGRTKISVLVKRPDSGKGVGRQWNKHLSQVLEEVVHLGGGHGVKVSDEGHAWSLERASRCGTGDEITQ
jgi:hypothetical protein